MKEIKITVDDNNTLQVTAVSMVHYEILGALHGAIAAVQGAERNTKPAEQLLNTEEAIKLLRCSKRTIQNWRNEKRIPFKTIGGKLYYAKEDLLKLMK
jgi:excisionase family DNA binding protein